jgi:hypothetical protein
MNTRAILLATVAFLAVSSFLMIGGIGIQTAEAGSGLGCNHKGGASTTVDANTPNAANTDTSLTTKPTV